MGQGLHLSQKMALSQVLAPQLQQSLALLQAVTHVDPEQPWSPGHSITTLPSQSTSECKSAEQWFPEQLFTPPS